MGRIKFDYKNLSDEERKALIVKMKMTIAQLQDVVSNLVGNCKHKIVEVSLGRGLDSIAKCKICDMGFGWWCLKSIDHICEYSQRDDECDFCGRPEERK